MNVTRIRAENFRSWKTLELDLPVGVTAITGQNGAGKTSLLSVIDTALFGAPLRDYLSDGETTLLCEVEFEHGGETYRVRRSYTAKGDDIDLVWARHPIDVTDAVVRVRYEATPNQARRLDQAEIRSDLLARGAHRVHAIQATIVAPDRARSSAVTDETGPAEAVDAYIASRELDDATGEQLRDRTSAYLERAR